MIENYYLVSVANKYTFVLKAAETALAMENAEERQELTSEEMAASSCCRCGAPLIKKEEADPF